MMVEYPRRESVSEIVSQAMPILGENRATATRGEVAIIVRYRKKGWICKLYGGGLGMRALVLRTDNLTRMRIV